MRFPTYWIREEYRATADDGSQITRHTYGWSIYSEQEARQMARQRARQFAEAAARDSFDALQYGYGVDPAREELIDTVEVEGEPIAALTRNRYGALVLNTERVMFADIDRVKPTGTGWLGAIFGRAKPEAPTMALDRMRYLHETHPEITARLYRTAAGWRVLFTDAVHEPTSEESVSLLTTVGSDPLYVALCQRQKCFRARLTPKPWRCGLNVPGRSFPYQTREHEQAQRNWERGYDQTIASYATCELVEQLGTPSTDPIILATIELHDRHTLNPGKPLA